MAIVKTTLLLEQDLRRAAALAEDYRRQENQALLDKINAACDDTPNPEDEKALKASQRAFTKMQDRW